MLSDWKIKFDAQHNAEGPGVPVEGSNLLFFADGARRNRNSWEETYEPDEDLVKRWQCIVLYREAVLRKATKEFTELKRIANSKMQHARREGFGEPSMDEMRELHAKREEVRALQKNVADAKAMIEEVTPERVKASRLAHDNHQHELAHQQAEIDNCRL